MTESGNQVSQKERDQLEGSYTFQRIVELELNPVSGTFDVDHLKEINRRMFQDLPALGFEDITPGRFRSPVPESRTWVKHRRLESVNVSSHVAYSGMGEAAKSRLDKALSQADPVALGKLKTAEFSQAIVKLYTELDYIHPFPDGNSRTLRVFTKQLANAAGYQLDWTRFANNSAGRDMLYIARDRSVNEIALSEVQDEGTKRNIVFSLDQLEGNPDLAVLIRSAIRPSRAVAFQQLPAEEALKKHPELREAFDTLSLASQYFTQKIPGNPPGQQAALAAVASNIMDKLDKGHTTGFRVKPDQQPGSSKKGLSPPRARG